jgi:hypothetical protein
MLVAEVVLFIKVVLAELAELAAAVLEARKQLELLQLQIQAVVAAAEVIMVPD